MPRSVLLIPLEHFYACSVLMFYATCIFNQSAKLSSVDSAIIFGIIQGISAFVCIFTVDELGRKSLMMYIAFGVSTGMTLRMTIPAVATQSNSLQFSLMSLFIFVTSLGMLSSMFLCDWSLRGVASSIAYIGGSFFLFIWAPFFMIVLEPAIKVIGEKGIMVVSALYSSLFGFFFIYLMPETNK